MRTFLSEYVERKIQHATRLPEIQRLDENTYVSGQVTEAQLQSLCDEGVKAVLNLRSMKEVGQLGLGVLAREKEIVEGLGMVYENIPVPPPKQGEPADPELQSAVLEALGRLPKPVLVHCRTRGRVDHVLEGAK